MTVSDLIAKHEGLRLFPYNDSGGNIALSPPGKITVGFGRNLTDVGISEDEAKIFLANDIDRAEEGIAEAWPAYQQLDAVRKAVVLDMVYNMGLSDFLEFKETMAAIAAGDWQVAQDHMLASKWASQVGARAVEDATMILTGQWPEGT